MGSTGPEEVFVKMVLRVNNAQSVGVAAQGLARWMVLGVLGTLHPLIAASPRSLSRAGVVTQTLPGKSEEF